MANAEKGPEEPPNKKSKTKHTTDDAGLDFFLEPLWESLGSLNSTKRIEAPAPAPAEREPITMDTPSRYANAPSLFDLVQINLLDAPTLFGDSSTIPEKRSRLQIASAEEETVETDTQHHTPSTSFTHTQTGQGEQEPRSSQITSTTTAHINTIVIDSETPNVPEPNQSDARNSAASNFANINDYGQPSNASTSNDTHIIHDDDDSNSEMSIDQDNQEIASPTPDKDDPSVVKDEPNHQGSNAIATAQRQSSGTPLNKTTSYHSLEIYEDIGSDEEGEDVFVDTSEILIDVEAEDEEQEESSQSSDEFYDVKEAFSATVSTITTPTVIEEEADRQLQDDTSLIVLDAIEAAVEHMQADVEQEEEEEDEDQLESDAVVGTDTAAAEKGEIMDQDDELGDEQDGPEQAESEQDELEQDELEQDELGQEKEAGELTEESEDEQAEDNQERSDSGQAQPTDNDVEAQENEVSQEGESHNVESTRESDTNESVLQSAITRGDSFNQLEGGELDTDNDAQPDEADIIPCDANEDDGQPSVMEDTALNAVEPPSNGMDDVEQLDTDETNEQQPSAIEENISINASVAMQQHQPSDNQDTLLSVEQQDPVSAVGDQAVASPPMQDEQVNQNEQAHSSDLANQDDQLPALDLEDEQLLGIDEVHFLMVHQDEQMGLHEAIEEEVASTAMPDAVPSSAVHEDSSPDHEQQIQMDDNDNDDTDKNDQQVVNDENANTTGTPPPESDHAHSSLLEVIQDILQESSQEAAEQQQHEEEEQVFTIESEPAPPPPLPTQNDSDADTVMSQSPEEIITDADDENDNAFLQVDQDDEDKDPNYVADDDDDDDDDDDNDSDDIASDDMDVEMEDTNVESESDEAMRSGSPSQAASVMDDSEQDIASIRDSFALDSIQNQSPFSQQSEAVEEYEIEESDDQVQDTQEPDVVVKKEPGRTATATAATSERIVIDLISDSEEEVLAEDDETLRDREFIDMSSLEEEEEDDLMPDILSETEDQEEIEQEEQQDVQTQEPVAVALDDVPSICLEADLDAMGDRTVCNMDLPPYASVPMWWYDAHDSNQTGIVYLFGKVFDDQQDKHVSCCVRIKNIARELYILPRQFQIDDEGNPTPIRVDLNDVQQELKTLLQHKRVDTFKMTTCEKQYAFTGKDIPRKATYIKLQYSYKDYEFPTTQSGKTFSHIFGANTNPLEHFLIQHDIMGPCWLNLVQCNKLGSDVSWCALNIGLDDPQCCSVLREEREAPPLNVMSLSLQTNMGRFGTRSNKVMAASLFFCKDVNVDTLDYTAGLNGYRNTIICLPPNMSYPADAYEHTEGAAQHTITLENTEFALLSRLLAAIHIYDPDIISGHNFFGGDLNTLLTRMKQLGVPHWHKLGRLKSKMLPKTAGSSEGSISSAFYQRLHMRGRIVCDTFEASQDLIKSKSFHLSELAKTQLDIVRTDIKPQKLKSYYKTGPQLLALAKHCSLDAYLTFALMAKLQILPLTKQLTRLSGNLWSRSIHGARSERNEYLLLHTFHKKGYLCPDSPASRYKKHMFEFVNESLELELPASKRLGANGKEMPSFEGGLVLEPKTGIYDTYVLLLDFNSLYPSIMQEYNVCFTTMDVNAEVIDTEAPPPPPPRVAQQTPTTMGVLPELVKRFVDRRKQVKRLMNEPSVSAAAKARYHIEQMGLKLTANSMYGCLGSSYSRFFARPLAAFITAKGRDILRDTVRIAEQADSVDVIYGDTDSIMINTHQRVYSRAHRIGQQLKDQVNTKYTMLEIDIDGVFRRTLLLKKKKYAAQVVTQEANGSYKETLEVKGLDIVRRDGCDLSRGTSENVLQFVLSNQRQEDIVNRIHAYLEQVGNRVRDSEVPVHEYIIRKQLTKSPEEYRTTKGNPHVAVAKDMRRSGIAVKAGDTIPYIYCIKTTRNGAVVEREPRMPDDVYSGKAVIDKDWYLLKQVLPSVARICIPLQGTDVTKLTESLHMNRPQQPSAPAPPSTDSAMQVDPVLVTPDEVEQEGEEENENEEDGNEENNANIFKIKGQHHSKQLEPRCVACDQLMSSNTLTCTCGATLTVASLYCQTLVAVRRFIHLYYNSPLVCSEAACGFETRDQFPVDDTHCLQMNCPGKLIRQYSAGQLYDQIASFKDTVKHLGQSQDQDVSCVLTMLDTVTDKSAYNYIDFNTFCMK